jgi:hypothetical protein
MNDENLESLMDRLDRRNREQWRQAQEQRIEIYRSRVRFIWFTAIAWGGAIAFLIVAALVKHFAQ